MPSACGSDDGSDTGGTDGTGGGGEQTELTVSGASSLTDAFGQIGTDFEGQNPGVKVTFNFGPSDGLATQINDGAPVDVFASASPTWMDSVQEDGPGVSDRADFAKNRLTIIVPTDNPAGIEDVGDLAEDDVQLVIAAEGVPAGDYAREIFTNAGIVYVTDVTSDVADQVTQIEIPDDVNVIATYPIAIVDDTQETDLARSFVDYVLGPGQQTLAEFGFLPA